MTKNIFQKHFDGISQICAKLVGPRTDINRHFVFIHLDMNVNLTVNYSSSEVDYHEVRHIYGLYPNWTKQYI